MNRSTFCFGMAAVVATCLLGNVNAVRAETQAQAALKANIVKFAQSKLGTKVDLGQGGECTELIHAALKQHGGQPMFHRKTVVNENGKIVWIPSYGWGARIGALLSPGSAATAKIQIPQPGSIVQFEKCAFGSWTFPHHTAIVESVNGTKVTLLHQNVDGGVKKGFPSVVRRHTIDFATKASGGTFAVWNPLPK